MGEIMTRTDSIQYQLELTHEIAWVHGVVDRMRLSGRSIDSAVEYLSNLYMIRQAVGAVTTPEHRAKKEFKR